jgi:hypothetical protein
VEELREHPFRALTNDSDLRHLRKKLFILAENSRAST